ncbi:MAG: type IVB secretion system protein IcmG/DotF [Proteobacteria bacterium]|nr:type IVB secretion system protein IcmG/DotF [Pseudomonadota bacterium]
MVDDQHNDEYEFSEIDSFETNLDENAEKEDMPQKPKQEGSTNVRRNALIVMGGFAALLLAYKFFGGSKNTTSNIDAVPPIAVNKPIQPVSPTQQIQQQPINVQTTPVQTTSNPMVEQKLSDLEVNQQNIRSDMSSVSSQMSSVNSNVNELTQKIEELSETITNLNAKLEQQSNQIAVLTERTRPKIVKKPRVIRPENRISYYIQAVIPGRAWLIATNGSTLTVREGTQIAGLGVVRLIDPAQGKVIMSSGRVIRFSQQDS